MSCARCGLDLTAVTAAYCPRCGEPLPYASPAPTPTYPEYPGAASRPMSPRHPSGGYDNAAPPSSPSYGPPSYGPPPGDPTYPSAYPTSAFAPPSSPLYGAPTTGEPPGYPPTTTLPPGAPYNPPYGAYGAYGAYDPYGAAAQHSTPMYQPGGSPYYGQSVPPSMPLYPGPGMPPWAATPPRPKRSPVRWLASAGFLVILLCVIAGIVLHNYTPSVRTGVSNTAGAPAGMHLILRDTMLGTNDGWANDSHCFFGSDGYHVKDGYICYAPTSAFADGSVAVTTKQVFGSIHYYYGIVLRRISKGNYYAFSVDSNGYWAFIRVVNDKTSIVGNQHTSAAIKTGIGASNTLEVRASGTHFQFFINSTPVGEADDSTYSSGKVGVDGGGSGLETVFTNFTVAVPN